MAAPSTAIQRTELSVGFTEFSLEASRRGFIGPRVLKPRLVGKQEADVGKVPLEQLLQTEQTLRTPRTAYGRSTFEFTTFSYACKEHGFEEPIDDADLKMYSDVVDAETIHAARVQDRVLRRYEIEAAAKVFDATVWTEVAGLQTAVGVAWDQADTATPISDVAAAKRAIFDRTGLWPNKLALNKRVFEDVQVCAEVLERVLYGGTNGDPANVTAEALASIFGLDEVLVAEGAYNSANEGQDATITPIWTDGYAMLFRAAVTDDMAEPCIGRTFLWPGDGAGEGPDASQIGVILEEYREEKVRGSVLRARTYYDLQILYASAGQLLSGLTTSE